MNSNELSATIVRLTNHLDKRFKDIGEFENQLGSHKYNLVDYTNHLHKIQDLVRLTMDEWEERTTYVTIAGDLIESDNQVIEAEEWKGILEKDRLQKITFDEIIKYVSMSTVVLSDQVA
jgi:hypothetical protein